MEVRINGVTYVSIEEMEGQVACDVVSFLREWYNDSNYVQGHTSGSTGVPKAIALLKQDMRASARLTNTFLGIDSSATLLLCLSPAYIAGKMMIVRALEAHAELVVVEPSSMPLQDVKQPITLAAMVPMQVATTLQSDNGEEQLAWVKQLLVGGAPISTTLEQRLMQLATHTYVTYGMTETVSHIALRAVGARQYVALGDVSFAVDNRNCLVIDAPQLSQRHFVTNDVVSLIDSRHFEWLGRYDNIINSGGLKFCAEDLERKISAILPHRYYITSCADELLGQRIVLVIESQAYSDAEMSRLKDQLSGCLSRYEMPREIRFVERFEETYSGKIKRIL